MLFQTPGWDLALFRVVNDSWRNALFDVVMPWFSSPAFLWGIVLLGLTWGARRYGRKQLVGVLVLLVALGAADLGTNLVKKSCGRLRPLNSLPGVHLYEDGQWQQRPADFGPTKQWGNSYPSAHAANSMAAACIIALLWPGLRRYVWLLPLVVGYSRLYLGKHFFTDVASGWLLGLGIALVVMSIVYVMRGRWDLGDGKATEPPVA